MTAGIAGGTIFGIAGFLILINYGGNYGCWPIIDQLFNDTGYLSCSAFGATAGIILGTLAGVVIRTVVQSKDYIKSAVVNLVAAFMLPFIYGVVMFSQDPNALFTLVPAVIFGFAAYATVAAALLTMVVNWKMVLRRKS